MPIQIDRPRTLDVTKTNPIEFIYLKGDADTDGSLRLLPDEVEPEIFEFERRENGVWNTTGLSIASNTIEIGRDLRVGGVGDWIRVTDADGDINAIVPHHEFSDAGTVAMPHTINLGPLLVRLVVQPDFSVERSGLSINTVLPSPFHAFRSKLYYKTGSIAATADVKLTIQRDDISGSIIWQKNFPASDFIANTELEIALDGFVELPAGANVSITFSSDNTISILGNASNQNWVALDIQLAQEEWVITAKAGMDRVLNDCAGGTIADNSGNLILSGSIDS